MASESQPAAPVRALGFRPPSLQLDVELEWVLQRSFGPLDWAPRGMLMGQSLVDLALRLDVAARIATRHSRDRLEREMGLQPAQRLRQQYVASVARSALLNHAFEQVLERASAFNLPVILLKYAALERMGVLRVGARVASDIDILVPDSRSREFQAILIDSGHKDLGLAASNHQLPALLNTNGVLVEVHLHIPFVTIAPSRSYCRAEDLLASDLTTQSGNARLPALPIVAAHAMAHGLLQHALAPHMYSPLKTFADLADLQARSPDVLEQAGAYLATSMTPEDIANVRTLAKALREGDLELATNGGPGLILRHALASQLDRRYAVWLRLTALLKPKASSRPRTPAEHVNAVRAAWKWARSLRSGHSQ